MHRKTNFDTGLSQQAKGEIHYRLAELLRRERQRLGLSQQGLSLDLGRGPKYIWRLENGYSEPDIYEFMELMEALGIYPPDAMKELV